MRLPDDDEITEDGQSGPLDGDEGDSSGSAAASARRDDEPFAGTPGALPQAMIAPAREPTWQEEPHDLPPIGYLFLLAPASEYGAYFMLHDDTTIGRMQGHTIRLRDLRVSETHARIRWWPHPHTGEMRFILYDFGTSNGTFVNGEAVFGAMVLHENDEIRIGGFRFRFKVLAR